MGPCKNPNCKSYGKIHPNCRCYNHLADGGDASFCSGGQPHESGCEYFAEGGDALPSFDQTEPAPNQAILDTPPTNALPKFEDALPKFEDTQEASEQKDALPAFEETEPNKYGSIGQSALAGLEAVARGASAGKSDVEMQNARHWAEENTSNPDFYASKREDVAGRQEAHPYISNIGQVIGSALLLRALPLGPSGDTVIKQVGSAILKNAIAGSAIQYSNETSKALLGEQDADHAGAASSVMARVGAAGLINGLTAGVFSGSSAVLRELGNSKAGTKALSFLAGIAMSDASRAVTEEESAAMMKILDDRGLSGSAADAGSKFIEKGLPVVAKKLASKGTDFAGMLMAKAALPEGPIGYGGALGTGYVLDKILGPHIERIVGKTLSKAAYKYAVPAVLKAMSAGETHGLWDILDYANKMDGGAQLVNKAVENVFKAGGLQAIEDTSSRKHDDKLKAFIEDGGIDQEMKDAVQAPTPGLAETVPAFASGGEVGSANHLASLASTQSIKNKNIKASNQNGIHNSSHHKYPIVPNADSQEDHVARLYPEQASIMNMAKARISTYLNSVRPQANQRLTFDDVHKDPHQERSYDKAIAIANRPLSILNHIKDGTLTPDHMAHFNSMYPELNQHLQKKLTEKILHSKIDGEKPNYRTRQSLSLFMGAPLDSTMTPAAIQSAQSVYVAQKSANQAMGQQQGKMKKNTSKLDKASNNYLTGDQAAIKRRNHS